MKILNVISIVLLILGGLNWGLFGLFEFNFVEFVFRSNDIWKSSHPSALARIVYILIGISAVYQIIQIKRQTSLD